MEIKKFPNGCWTKLFIGLLLIAIVFLCFLAYIRHLAVREKMDRMIELMNSDMAPIESLVTVSVQYKDSAYCVVASDIHLWPELKKSTHKIDQLELPYRSFLALSCYDTLEVDSNVFAALKEYKVVPQFRIDSVFMYGGVNALVNSFFNHRCLTDTTLTEAEQRYLIDLLQRNSFKFYFDDESGYLYFVRQVHFDGK